MYLNRNQVDNANERLVVGKTYYSFYFEVRGKGRMMRHTGIFEVKLERVDSLGYGRWETSGGKMGSIPSIQNLLNQIYYNDCWSSGCNFFLDEESARKAHNSTLKKSAPDHYEKYHINKP